MNSIDDMPTDASWDDQIASLLTELSEIQQQTLDYLAEKHERLMGGKAEVLSGQQEREEALMHRLQSCHDRRQALLDQAAEHGLPSRSLTQLSSSLGEPERSRISPILTKASSQARLLRHHSLANWVLAQRHLIHISHLIEILATGGKRRPTYGNGDNRTDSGALVDRAA